MDNSLSVFLGMTEEEFRKWAVSNDDADEVLRQIINDHKAEML